MSNEKPNGNVDRYRIDQLERLAEALTARFEQSQGANTQEMRSLRSAIEELHRATLLFQNKVCPAPGTCIELTSQLQRLAKQVESNSDQIRKILLHHAEQNGMLKTWRLPLTITLTALITAVVVGVVNHLLFNGGGPVG